MRGTIVILEEGNQPYPIFPICNMFVLQQDIDVWHPSTDLCRRGEEHKHHKLAAEEVKAGKETALTSYVIYLTPISYFKYPEIIMSVLDDDWPAVVRNLIRVCNNWLHMTRVLGREGEDARTSGMFNVAVVQAAQRNRL